MLIDANSKAPACPTASLPGLDACDLYRISARRFNNVQFSNICCHGSPHVIHFPLLWDESILGIRSEIDPIYWQDDDLGIIFGIRVLIEYFGTIGSCRICKGIIQLLGFGYPFLVIVVCYPCCFRLFVVFVILLVFVFIVVLSTFHVVLLH